jgi:hypothetical protein
MSKSTKTTTIDTSIPDFLKRSTNAKGVTLSAGVVATGAKVEPKPLSKKAQRKADAEVARKAKEAAPVVTAPVVTAPVAPKSTPTTAAPAVGPDGQPLEKVKRSIVPMKFKARYAAHGGTCGDDMALELKAATTTRNADKREVLDVEALWAIAKVNEIDVSKYVSLNNGQKRMNVGNKLRGKLAAGADVVIGTRTFKAEDFVPKA